MSKSSLAKHTMTAYIRNTKAVGVLWSIFTLCYAIVAVLIFFQPYWLGSTDRSDQSGVFGLYTYCTYARSTDVSVETCKGELSDYHRIASPYFKIATVFVGLSAVLVILCILCIILFACVRPKIVYTVCGVLQFLAFLCLLIGCIVYPAAWDNPAVKSVCGQYAKKYNKGACEIRWSYILAIVGVFDLLFLCLLSFVLASKQLRKFNSADQMAFVNMPLPVHLQALPPVRGCTNGISSNSLVPIQYGQNNMHGTGDRMSQFSSTIKPSNRARAEYAASVQNFQL